MATEDRYIEAGRAARAVARNLHNWGGLTDIDPAVCVGNVAEVARRVMPDDPGFALDIITSALDVLVAAEDRAKGEADAR